MRRKCRLFDSSWVFFHVCLKTSYFYPKTPLLNMQQRSVLKKWTTICIEVMTCSLLHCDKNVMNIYRKHNETMFMTTLWKHLTIATLWRRYDNNVTIMWRIYLTTTLTCHDDIILNIVTSQVPVRLLVQVGQCGM